MINVLEHIALIVLRILAFTWRIQTTGVSIDNKRGVFAFWHDVMLPGWYVHRTRKCIAMVSKSNDGEKLSRILHAWNIETLRGSSSQSGKEVLQEAIQLLKQDYSLLITPDGPRGPRHSMKAGAIIAALRSSSPLYLVRISIQHSFVFKKSWDQFALPLPFSTITVHYTGLDVDYSNQKEEYVSTLLNKCERILNGD